jgi:aspartate-semialdehyde dehydrogenase
MGYRIVVAGATGNVGREVLAILAEREFPYDELAAVASSRSQGDEIEIGDTGKTVKCQNIENFDWSGWDMAIFAIGSDATAIHAPKAAAAGCVVIDNSSLYRMDPDVPLIVPEVNPEAIDGYTAKNIIANPNCSTAQMVVALKPLHDAATIKRVVVSTYQSVSGAGKAGMDELWNQTRQIFVGHSEAINIELEDELPAEEAQRILREAPGVVLHDKREDGGYITPVEAVGDFATFVSRVRDDPTVDNGLNLWCVSDNLRKGAALNAVQIAELLGRRHLKKG